jgi:hypothetical protein
LSKFIEYSLSGIKRSIIIGVPDFCTNNQFEDMQNISNDFTISYNRIICNASQKNNTKRRKLRVRKLRARK